MCNTQKRSFLRAASSITLLEAALFITFNAILSIEQLQDNTNTDNNNNGQDNLTTILPTTILPTTTLTSITTVNDSVTATNSTPASEDDFLTFFKGVNTVSLLYVEELALSFCYNFNVAIDVVWFLISLTLLYITSRKNLFNGSYIYLLPWIVVTVGICLTDVAELAYFTAKLYPLTKEDWSQDDDILIVKKVFLPVFFIKGVVIWIINVVLMVLMTKSYIYFKAAHQRSKELDEDNELKSSINEDGSTYQSLDKLKREDHLPGNEYDNYAFEEDVPSSRWDNNSADDRKRAIRPPSADTSYYINNHNERKRQQVPPDDTRYYDDNFKLKTKQLVNDLQHRRNEATQIPKTHRVHRDSLELVAPRPPKPSNPTPNGRSALNHPAGKASISFPDPNTSHFAPEPEKKKKKPKSALKKAKDEPTEDPLKQPHIKPATIPEAKYSIPRVALKKY